MLLLSRLRIRGFLGSSFRDFRSVALVRSLFKQHLDQGLFVGGDIGRTPCGDQISVHNNRLVQPLSAGVAHVIFDAGGAGDLFALQDLGGGQHPASVADDADELAGVVELPDQGEHLRETPQLVRCPAAGDQNAVRDFDSYRTSDLKKR